MRITEENFVSQILMGNEEAISYVIEQYGWVIKTIVKKHLYQMPHYEEDCINDILLTVWQHIDRFNPGVSSFKNWLAGISKYKSLNYVRKYKRDLEQQSIEDLELATEDLTYEKVVKEEINKEWEEVLNCIKPQDKELFIKLYVKGQSIDEVSAEMGIKKNVIYNRICRAKKKLKKLF